MIRATAQAHGKDTVMENGQSVIRWKRDPRIAEAMVDEGCGRGVTDSGKVVTFTPHEAMQYGFCDGLRRMWWKCCKRGCYELRVARV